MTYSIIARERPTGQFGIAIQSHFFCVGDGPPWARAGVGAVCTQAFTEVSYGPAGLNHLDEGCTARETVHRLIAADAGRDRRQVGVVDRDGGAFAFTGELCIGYAGDAQGDGVTAQANMVSSPNIWTAMVAEFEATRGSFADRLLSALLAAESDGGDSRGRQSAALLIVGEGADAVDLRVDDHPDPLAELARLLQLRRAYEAISRALSASLLVAPDSRATESALADLRYAASALGDNPEAIFWEAVILARADRIAEARAQLARSAIAGHGWNELFRRLPAAGLVSAEAAELVAGEEPTR